MGIGENLLPSKKLQSPIIGMRYPLKFYIKQTKTFLDFLENEKSPFFKLKLSNIASAKLLLPVFKMVSGCYDYRLALFISKSHFRFPTGQGHLSKLNKFLRFEDSRRLTVLMNSSRLQFLLTKKCILTWRNS